jgi:hypothetical protein
MLPIFASPTTEFVHPAGNMFHLPRLLFRPPIGLYVLIHKQWAGNALGRTGHWTRTNVYQVQLHSILVQL